MLNLYELSVEKADNHLRAKSYLVNMGLRFKTRPSRARGVGMRRPFYTSQNVFSKLDVYVFRSLKSI